MSRAENKHSIVREVENLNPFVPPITPKKALLRVKIRRIRKEALTSEFREQLRQKDNQRWWEKMREIIRETSRRSPVEG